MSKRLFLAIPLPDDIKDELGKWQSLYNHPMIRWVPRNNLHITTHFIGKTSPGELDEITKNVEEFAAAQSSFALRFEEVVPVFKGKNLHMIWAQMEQSEPFSNLFDRLNELFDKTPDHPANPHITLARIKQLRRFPKTLREARQPGRFMLEVNKMELWESRLGSDGANYFRLAEFEFSQSFTA